MAILNTVTYFLSSGRKVTIKVLKKHQGIKLDDDNIKNIAFYYFNRIKKYKYNGGGCNLTELPMACTFNRIGQDYNFVSSYNMSGLSSIY